MMKNWGVLISESLFFGLTSLGEARQNISHSISFFLIIIDLEVVSREFLSLTDLTKAQAFCIHKSMEVIIVNKNKDLVFVAFQVVLPSLKGFNNS